MQWAEPDEKHSFLFFLSNNMQRMLQNMERKKTKIKNVLELLKMQNILLCPQPLLGQS